MTVFQDAVGQGKTALAVALKLIKGEKVESHVWIPFELVTKENMQTYGKESLTARHRCANLADKTGLIMRRPGN